MDLPFTLAQAAAPPRPAPTAPAAPPPAPRLPATAGSIQTQGEPTNLRLGDDKLAYCDKRGARVLDIRTSQDAARNGTCPPVSEGNTTCGGLILGTDITVRSVSPDDIVDIDRRSARVKGHVRDCAIGGRQLVVATGASVALIDIATARVTTLDREGGERVLINEFWVIWTTVSGLRWAPRPPH